jgi:hypothetical protein
MVPENKQNIRYNQIKIGRQIRGVRWVDFFVFPRLKSIMKGTCFTDVAAIQERVTAVLRSILKETFAEFPEAL